MTDIRRAAIASGVLAALCAGACAGDLSPQSLVERFRVLAVRADAPEASPGETVTLDGLLGDPTGGDRTVSLLWVACLLGTAADLESCADPSGAGIVGVGFTDVFGLVVPPLPEGESDAQVLVTLSACAGGTFVLPEGEEELGPRCEGGDGATAYKRVIVSEDAERNHNPTLRSVTLDGAELTAAGTTLPACGEGSCRPLEVAAVLGEGSAETFTAIEFGEPVERTEEVYTSWFATAGSFERIRSAGTTPRVEWTPPSGTETVGLWIVVHDGRGGTDWLSTRIVLE